MADAVQDLRMHLFAEPLLNRRIKVVGIQRRPIGMVGFANTWHTYCFTSAAVRGDSTVATVYRIYRIEASGGFALVVLRNALLYIISHLSSSGIPVSEDSKYLNHRGEVIRVNRINDSCV